MFLNPKTSFKNVVLELKRLRYLFWNENPNYSVDNTIINASYLLQSLPPSTPVPNSFQRPVIVVIKADENYRIVWVTIGERTR